MRSATIVLIGCALVSFVGPDTVLGEGAMRLDELKEIVKAVEVEADAWARSSYTTGKVKHRIRNVWYDQGSIGPLRTVLEIPREKPNELFVACRIISPMINAKPAVIAEALGMFHPIAEQLAVYKDLPTYTEKQLEAMAPAEDASEADKDLASKLRAEKRKDELDVQKHNGQVRALRAIVYRMMVRSRNRDQDTRLLHVNRVAVRVFPLFAAGDEPKGPERPFPHTQTSWRQSTNQLSMFLPSRVARPTDTCPLTPRM